MPSNRQAAPKATLVVPTKAAKGPKSAMSVNSYIALVAVGAGLIAVIGVLISYNLIKHIILDTKVIAGDNTAKSALETKLNNIPTLISNYNNLGSKQQLIADALPTDANFPQLVAIMDAITADSHVQLKMVSPATVSTGGTASSAAPSAASSSSSTPAGGNATPSPYIFTAEVVGPYPQIVAFFKDLEQSARPMRVTTSSIISSSGDLDVTMSIQTYFQSKANVNDTTEVVK